jgi:hypothetical protein
MAEEDRRDEQKGGDSGSGSAQSETGDPGRTPGTAEGDEETVDEDLRDKGSEGQG